MFSHRGRRPSLDRTTLNPYVLSLLLFCLSIVSLLYIKLSFCKYCSYCQVSLTSILRVKITIGIRAYQFHNNWYQRISFSQQLVPKDINFATVTTKYDVFSSMKFGSVQDGFFEFLILMSQIKYIYWSKFMKITCPPLFSLWHSI